MKKLYAGYTQYQLLIFLLLKDKNDEITFILPKYLEKLGEKLKKNKVIILEQEKPQLKKIFQFLNYYKYIKDLVKKLNISEDTVLYGDSIINYIISDNNILCRLEDGTGNYSPITYQEEVRTLKKKIYYKIDSIIYYIFFKKKLLSEKEKINKRINKFYATEMAPQNIWFEKIIERINLKKIWEKKTLKEKQEILNIFDIKQEILEKIKEKTIILFTQPLSEEKMISEEEKIDLYSKVLKNYDTNLVIIKPHPREKTEYKKIFKKCLVMNEIFPSELLFLLGFVPKKAVTLFSSAVFVLDENVEKDFYGTEIHPKILEICGSSKENLINRNAFL